MHAVRLRRTSTPFFFGQTCQDAITSTAKSISSTFICYILELDCRQLAARRRKNYQQLALSDFIWGFQLQGFPVSPIVHDKLYMAFYRPLDQKNEVRMLTIVDSPDGDTTGLVHCTLEHVSLDDLTPEFANFLSETNQICNDIATRSWLEKLESENKNRFQPSASRLQLPVWR